MSHSSGEGKSQPIVFLVCKDEEVLWSLKPTLDNLSCTLITATCPNEALRLFKDSGDVALVISCLHMSKMNGFEFMKKIKELSETTQRLLLTKEVSLHSLVDAVHKGIVTRVVSQPWDPEKMSRSVAELMMIPARISEPE